MRERYADFQQLEDMAIVLVRITDNTREIEFGINSLCAG